MTFMMAIEDVMNNFHTKYTTLGSLHNIMILLNNLSAEQKLLYQSKIDYLTNTIKGFGARKDDDRILTTNQSKRIGMIINEMSEVKISTNTSHPMIIHSSVKSKVNEYQPYKPNRQPYGVAKFTPDDLITQVVFGLLTSLNHHSLTSSINMLVYDYFEMCEFILSEDYEKYNAIIGEIGICLESHGWVLKSEKTLGGFKREPDRLIITQDLQKIVNKWF